VIVTSIVVGFVGVLVLVPCVVFATECVAACLPGFRGRRKLTVVAPRPKLAIVVPAHDEAGIVGHTVAALRPEMAPGDRLIVVADNCRDGTAAEARAAGAEVWNRNDPDRRGKGYAIAFAVARLAPDPPRIVVIVDADCVMAPGSVGRIARAAAHSQGPAQATYLMKPALGSGPLAALSAFAFMVRNLVRPLGLARMGFPCQLTGTGMAFPWALLQRAAPDLRGHIVEDLALGLALARQGHPPFFVPESFVTSVLPVGQRAARTQRRRWEHGQLATLADAGPGLLKHAVAARRPALLALLMDLAVPPLALLALLASCVFLAALALATAGGSPVAVLPAALGLALVGLSTLAAWLRFGRDVVPAWTLALAPLYVVSKLPLYLAFLFRRRQRAWVRTERAVTAAPDPLMRP
jgi:cellulose synthase/poly-beta-1,6-N-acetylglucosamine synthase-like glycosyltransferase